MALVGTLKAEDKYNSYCEDIKNIYYKIEGVYIDTERNKVRVAVRGYMSEFARHNQGIGVFKRVFYIDLDYFADVKCNRDELTKASYMYISQLPEFTGCRNSFAEYKGEIKITKEQIEKDEEDLEELINKVRFGDATDDDEQEEIEIEK